MPDPTDPRTRIRSRIRFWRRQPRTAGIRAVERLFAGSQPSVLSHQKLAHIPQATRNDCVESFMLSQKPTLVYYSSDPKPAPWLPTVDAIDAHWTYVIRESFVAPASGAIWLPSGKSVPELFGGADRYSGTQDVRGLSRTRPSEYLSGIWLLMPSHTYYHFLLEDIPALLASLDFSNTHNIPISGVLVTRDAPHYVTDFLETLEISMRFVKHRKVKIERLIATGLQGDARVHPASVTRIRQHFGTKESPGTKQLYVSRVGFRRAPNWERNLIGALREALPQLQVIEAQHLTHRQQISIFSQAELIIGMHGAGLSNIVFSPKTALVIEVGSENNCGDHFWRLSNLRGQPYDLVWIQSDMSEHAAIDKVISTVLGQKEYGGIKK